MFLAYINEESGRVEVIEHLLDQAAAGEIQIITSVVSVTEVAFAAGEKLGSPLDPDALVRISRLWSADSPVALADFHALIAEDARDLMRRSRPDRFSLKPIDAIHLATAHRLAADEFLTYDDLERFSGCVDNLLITEPHSGTLPFS